MPETGTAKAVPVVLCATHVECLGGASPLRAVMSGTVRLSKGDVLPPRGMQDAPDGDGSVAPPPPALPAPQTMQANPDHRLLPATAWRAERPRLDRSRVRQRLVALCGHSSRSRRDERVMV
jgi:hypothetical protein